MKRSKKVVRPGKIRIGLDFDGVVAYNPFRIVRAPIKWFKREILGITKVSFFVPKNWWQKLLWLWIHESSIYPAKGIDRLKKMAKEKKYEFYLITGRYGFLKGKLFQWINKQELNEVFVEIIVNEKHEQPHIFKEKIIRELNLDYYVEDNLDIVTHLFGKVKTQVYWIYNILDKRHNYATKYPNLNEALKRIAE